MTDDLIRRSDAIRVLQEVDFCSLAGAELIAIEAIKCCKAVEPKRGEWIPCSERMPEDPNPSSTYGSKTYQVTIERGEVIALKWHKREVRGKTVMRWEWSDGVIYHGDVLAWKPLSEPWKGAEDDTDNV